MKSRERMRGRMWLFFAPSRLPEFGGILTIISGCSLREAKREDRIALEEETQREEEKWKRMMARMAGGGRA